VRDVLYALLGVDGLQVVVAVAAFQRGRGSLRAGASSHARYSFRHGLLLLVGAVILAVPVALGLSGAISAAVALIVALVLEAAVLPVARAVVKRLEAAQLACRPAVAD
jgi:hypothetical protein